MPTPAHPDGPKSELRPLLEAVLHAAVDSWPTAGTDGRLRARMRSLCEGARRDGVAVERLLVLLKAGWWEQAEVREGARTAASHALAGLVTLCIHEFYQRPNGADRPPSGHVPPPLPPPDRLPEPADRQGLR